MTIHYTNSYEYFRTASQQLEWLNEVGGVEVGLRGRIAVQIHHSGDPEVEPKVATLCSYDLSDEPITVAGVDGAAIAQVNLYRHMRTEPGIVGNGLSKPGRFEITRAATDKPWEAQVTHPRLHFKLPQELMQTVEVDIHPIAVKVPTLGLAAQLLIAKAKLSDEEIEQASHAIEEGEPINRQQIAFLSLEKLMRAIRERENPSAEDVKQINLYRGAAAIPLRNMRTQSLRAR